MGKGAFFHYGLLLVAGLVLLTLAACGGKPTVRVVDTPQTRELPGWQRPYEVDGVRYYPLLDGQGFRERGTASWYGRDFHGRRTSNGEVYDMYAVSAAHKTLPMGSRVVVTHLHTGRQVTVRINDRGPFVGDRIIDLSYGAARELGMVETGLAEVEIAVVSSPALRSSVSAVGKPSSAVSYAIQIAAFSVADNAARLADQMRSRYGQSQVAAATVDGREVHRVRVGRFTSVESAERAVERLRAEGYGGSFIVAFN